MPYEITADDIAEMTAFFAETHEAEITAMDEFYAGEDDLLADAAFLASF